MAAKRKSKKQRKPPKHELRYALIVEPTSDCIQCLSHAGHEFFYKTPESALGHVDCTHRVVPGISGVSKIEGYDIDAVKERYDDIQRAREKGESIPVAYGESAEEFAKRFDEQWSSWSKDWEEDLLKSDYGKKLLTMTDEELAHEARKASRVGVSDTKRLGMVGKALGVRAEGNYTVAKLRDLTGATQSQMTRLLEEVPGGIRIDRAAFAGNWERCALTCGSTEFEAVFDEAMTRDRRWLFTGEKPAATFATQDLLDEIQAKRPHELKTGIRLTNNGLRADFQIDKTVVNGKTIGLPDLASGYEIKSITCECTYNTIDEYLSRSSKKLGCVAVVFDNGDRAMSQISLEKFILKSKRFKRGKVYVIDTEGNLKRVR